MFNLSLSELADKLTGSGLTYKTGIVLVEVDDYDNGEDLAVSLGIDYVDALKFYVDNLNHEAKYLGLDRTKLVKVISDILNCEFIYSNCICLAGIDALIAGLDFVQRDSFWYFMRSNFRNNKGIIIVMPFGDNNLLTNNEIILWNEVSRISYIGGGGFNDV